MYIDSHRITRDHISVRIMHDGVLYQLTSNQHTKHVTLTPETTNNTMLHLRDKVQNSPIFLSKVCAEIMATYTILTEVEEDVFFRFCEKFNHFYLEFDDGYTLNLDFFMDFIPKISLKNKPVLQERHFQVGLTFCLFLKETSLSGFDCFYYCLGLEKISIKKVLNLMHLQRLNFIEIYVNHISSLCASINEELNINETEIIL